MKNQRKKKRIIFVVTSFLVSIMALVFVIVNFRQQIVFFYSPTELYSAEILQKTARKQIRVGGLVIEKTVKREGLITEFTITDLQTELKINYKGILPDLFREKQGVVAKGKFDVEKNEFFASELLVKHDEKYMPPEVAKSLKR